MPDSPAPMKRISRACLRCRQRKSKCDIGSPGQPGNPPCLSCLRDNVECILATSNRGGRRVRNSNQQQQQHQQSLNSGYNGEQRSLPTSESRGHASSGLGEFARPMTAQSGFREPVSVLSNIEETIAKTDLHQTSDALNLLSQAAELGGAHMGQDRGLRGNADLSPGNNNMGELMNSESVGHFNTGGPLQYELVSRGYLTAGKISDLVARFEKNYHPYLPIAPRRSFEPSSLQFMAFQEPHLLTAMITVAARDLPQGEQVLEACSKYMHELVSELSSGKKCDVEAVEALLLLAEWEPQDSLSDAKKVGCGEEDRAAWMHVGLALRIGYYLGLDRTAIRHDDEEKAAQFNRRRLAWAGCYISDRMLSARIGRAFWSRGPQPLLSLGGQSRHDFPSLQPQSAGEDNHASIFQAHLDLTQLFSNVHDILYSGMGSSMKMMLAGNYVKYVDDFRGAIVGWKSVWGTLTCSPNLKATLQMSYEYLRLYTNAYAFQASSTQAASAKVANAQGLVSNGVMEIPHDAVASMPDARFIYESVDAAKTLLSIINSYVDAESCLRFLPLKYTLYCVNSAVFLYKAWSFGVLSAQEKVAVRHLISDAINHLQRASARPNDFASRYSQLLELLWQRKDSSNRPAISANPGPGGSAMPDPLAMTPSRLSAPFNPQDEFSWLDLQAVGELVTGDQDPGFVADANVQFVNAWGRDSLAWNDFGWGETNELNRLF